MDTHAPNHHDHDHDHGADHGHGLLGVLGHHDHDHQDHAAAPRGGRLRAALRFGVASLVAMGAVLTASAVTVGAGTAAVITEFGKPVRVITEPGLAWKLPAPVEAAMPVDLRLRTTSSGVQDVGTREGLRVLAQVFVAWQVPPDPDAIRQYVRAVRNDPDEAARQIRSFVGSALQVTASSFGLADLVNTDPSKLRLTAFETRLHAQIALPLRRTYGIDVRSVGIERFGLPDAVLAATVARMRTERETVAAQRTAVGLRDAARVRSEAQRDSRIIIADAQRKAADIEAASRREAAEIEARTYKADPELYTFLRSLDTLAAMVNSNTRLVLRTDAAPFSALVEGPPGGQGGAGSPFGALAGRPSGIPSSTPSPTHGGMPTGIPSGAPAGAPRVPSPSLPSAQAFDAPAAAQRKP